MRHFCHIAQGGPCLEVLWQCGGMDLARSTTATISRPISFTMSPVMEVTIFESGLPFRAILKLYDRRFGRDLRQVRGKPSPHTPSDEAAFRSFIQQGKMAPFLHELEEDEKASFIPLSVCRYHDGTMDGSARFEAAMWQECNKHFECETEAYVRLDDFQGTSIPCMYAHVRLTPSSLDIPEDLRQPQTARYFEIRGVLLERIHEHSLMNLAKSPQSFRDPSVWQSIVQSAADAAHAINRCGVLMDDCGPRNVVVDESSHRPFIIDLAQCSFKEKMVQIWEESGEYEEDEESEDWDPDIKYWDTAQDNPGAIGAVMTRLLREKGITLDIKYPDINEIIEGIKKRKGIT